MLRDVVTIVMQIVLGSWLFISDGPAFAEDYPVKPIKLIVPYPGGGDTDIAARWLGQKLSEALHQQIVVDNRAGANGNLGKIGRYLATGLIYFPPGRNF